MIVQRPQCACVRTITCQYPWVYVLCVVHKTGDQNLVSPNSGNNLTNEYPHQKTLQIVKWASWMLKQKEKQRQNRFIKGFSFHHSVCAQWFNVNANFIVAHFSTGLYVYVTIVNTLALHTHTHSHARKHAHKHTHARTYIHIIVLYIININIFLSGNAQIKPHVAHLSLVSSWWWPRYAILMDHSIIRSHEIQINNIL